MMSEKQKRPDTPQKSQGNTRRKLLKENEEKTDKEAEMPVEIQEQHENKTYADATGARAAEHGHPRGAGGSSAASANEEAPPKWLSAFEQRMDRRLDSMRQDLFQVVGEVKEAFHFHEQICDQKFEKLEKELEKCQDKLDDLENRSRRNNLIFFNIPEGEEKASPNMHHFTFSFLSRMVPELHEKDIERSHRTPSGPPPRPDANGKVKARPIHVCFASFQAREKVKRSCIQAFKSSQLKDKRFFVADDLSHRIQAQRKKLLPSLQRLRNAGKRAFFVFPATIKYIEGQSLKVFKPSDE